jgi:hypothetical protein
MNHSTTIAVVWRGVLTFSLALGLFAWAATPGRADLVVGIAAGIATPGSSANSFDVTLTNTGMSAADIAGFSFEITTSSSDVNFSDVNTSTQSALYIFGANSEFGPDITLGAGGNTVSAADNYAIANEGATLVSGQTLDLGHVLFGLDLAAPQTPIPLTFSLYPATGVNDPDGSEFQNVSIPSPGALTISVGELVVPEPASVFLGLQGLSLAYVISLLNAYRSRSGSPQLSLAAGSAPRALTVCRRPEDLQSDRAPCLD